MTKEWELRYDPMLNSHYYVNPHDNSIHFDSPQEVKRPRSLLGSIRRHSTGGFFGKIKRSLSRSPARASVPSTSSRSSTQEWSVKTVTPPVTTMPVVLPPRRSRSMSISKSSKSMKSISKSPQKSPLSTPPRELSPVPSLCSSTANDGANGVVDDVLFIEATLNDDWSIDSEDYDITSYDTRRAQSYYQAEHDAVSTASKLPEDRLELRMSLWSEIH